MAESRPTMTVLEQLERLELHEACRALLAREARLVDERRWSEWLELYLPECEYWVPAWHADQPTTDPRREMSLLHFQDRRGLEERVRRITSEPSEATGPAPPRTAHVVGSINVVEAFVEGGATVARVNAAFITHTLRGDRSHVFFGLYDYTLRRTDAGLRIARKRVLLMNDVIPSDFDLYSI